MAAASRLDILERAKPYVTQLVEATGETAHLGVLRQGEVVSLVNVESRYTVRTPATVGRHIPLHCTSQGKAILAFLPPDQVARQLKGYVFSRHSANTIVSKDRFLAELALVASRGYAVDNEEFEEGLRCIAAPVRDHSEEVAGAISIAGPTFRVTGSRLPALSREVKRIAAELSTALGYRGAAVAGGVADSPRGLHTNSRTASIEAPIEQSHSRSTITSTRYGTGDCDPPGERGLQIPRIRDALASPAKRLHQLDVIRVGASLAVPEADSVFVAVRVLLVLTDQAEVAIVHHDHQHRDLVLSGHGQFFRHEQEAGVSHHHHRRVVRVCHFGADRRRQLVAQSARAPRCQVAPRAFDILQLAGPDLGDAAARGEDRVGREEIVDFLKHALWLDGHVFVIGLAGQLSPDLGQALALSPKAPDGILAAALLPATPPAPV